MKRRGPARGGVLMRFWSKVEMLGDDECWLWTAARFREKNGELSYGQFRYAGRNQRANRVVWILTMGEIPDGMHVLHDCRGGVDNKSCVNPRHLYLGTDVENGRDRGLKEQVAHGDKHWSRTSPERVARGSRHGWAKDPSTIPRGDNHWARRHPERSSGDAHWTKKIPERLARGDSNGARKHPERLARGESIGNAKLTEEMVREIRRRGATGERQVEIASTFGVLQSTVSAILRRATWRHVT